MITSATKGLRMYSGVQWANGGFSKKHYTSVIIGYMERENSRVQLHRRKGLYRVATTDLSLGSNGSLSTQAAQQEFMIADNIVIIAGN